MKLHGKRIVITGGTSGIGYALVKQLHVNNDVIVISRNQQKLDDLAGEFEGVVTFAADLSDIPEVKRVTRDMCALFQSVDVLINNAAMQSLPTFLDDAFEPDSIAKEVTLNFTSMCYLTYWLLPLLQHAEPSVILNVNSGLGLSPKTSSAVYCGTKGALNIFSQSLGYQLESTNIRVQQAFLPLVDTPMTTGRGSNKLTAEHTARCIIRGIEQNKTRHYIGKVKLLNVLLHIAPWLAARIMKAY